MTTQSDRGLKLEPCPFCGGAVKAMRAALSAALKAQKGVGAG